MTSARVDPSALTSSLRRLAEQRDDSDLYVSLQRVIDFSGQLFTVTGGGLMLADEGGELHYIVASTGPSHLLEEVQIETGKAPASTPTSTTDDRHDRPGPRRALPDGSPRVVPHGIGAVLAVRSTSPTSR